MDRIKCEIREADRDDRGMLVLLAEETLHPLARAPATRRSTTPATS